MAEQSKYQNVMDACKAALEEKYGKHRCQEFLQWTTNLSLWWDYWDSASGKIDKERLFYDVEVNGGPLA